MRAEFLPAILQQLGIEVTTAQWNHKKSKLTEHWTEHPTEHVVNFENLRGRVEVKVESGQSCPDTCSSLEPRTPHEQPEPHSQALVLVEPQPHQVSQEQALVLVDVGGQQNHSAAIKRQLHSVSKASATNYLFARGQEAIKPICTTS